MGSCSTSSWAPRCKTSFVVRVGPSLEDAKDQGTLDELYEQIAGEVATLAELAAGPGHGHPLPARYLTEAVGI